MSRLAKTADSVTRRYYSWLQAIGWLILGNIAAGHHPWWIYTLYAVALIPGVTLLNELIRDITGLPHGKDTK